VLVEERKLVSAAAQQQQRLEATRYIDGGSFPIEPFRPLSENFHPRTQRQVVFRTPGDSFSGRWAALCHILHLSAADVCETLAIPTMEQVLSFGHVFAAW